MPREGQEPDGQLAGHGTEPISVSARDRGSKYMTRGSRRVSRSSTAGTSSSDRSEAVRITKVISGGEK